MVKGPIFRCAFCMLVVGGILAGAQEANLTARVALTHGGKVINSHQTGGAVLWLVPLGSRPASASLAILPAQRPQLLQKNKSFHPHLLVVPVGSVVEFPNRDPFFHNVFSLFEGKRFDLGLYEAGSSRQVLFDKPGISYIFCDIHAEMSAVIIALPTPYYGISDQRGQVLIAHVPAGRYILHLWDEAALPEELSAMTREVVISENTESLGLFRLTQTTPLMTHKNKYGLEYGPPAPDSPAYPQP
jgi:hypothetical protein